MKVFLITGASTGIGEAAARRAVEAGYRVVLAARSRDKLAALAEELGGPDQVLAVTCDVTDFASQQAMVKSAIDHFGQVDIVFANAGIGASGAGTQAGDPDNWRDMVLTNVLGVTYTAKAAFEQLTANRGHLLITGSRAGRSILKGSVYGATKWAVAGYAGNLREELNPRGIRVTLIEPGLVDTPFFDDPKPDGLTADDVARAVIYAMEQPESVNIGDVLVTPMPR